MPLKEIDGIWYADPCACPRKWCAVLDSNDPDPFRDDAIIDGQLGCIFRMAKTGSMALHLCDMCEEFQWFYKSSCIICWPPSIEKECMFHA